jgi:hypothetical protein
MIFKEVAIEPAYLSNWDRVRLILDQCGFEHGRLISDFPQGEWRWQVVESCQACLPTEKKRVEEYLKNVKSKLIRLGRQYIDANDWIQNAKREHARLPFHVVVTNAKEPECPDFIEGAELHAGHDKWKIETDAVIQRTTDAMGNAAKELLALSREIIFVDPNFEAKASYTKPLCRLVELAGTGSQVTRIEYHLEYDSTKEHFKGKLQTVLVKFLEMLPSANLRFVRWRSLNQPLRDAMHPRYILTELGGLRYDYGLCEGKDGETTDIQIIPKGGAVYQQRWADFCATSQCFEFMDGFEVTPVGVFEIAIRDGRFEQVG